MNKTISINIGGLFFQIDEQAYIILENYLDSLKKHFAGTEGSEEIIQDIESRIAEIFQTRIEAGNVMITLEHVEETIKILGNPGDIDNNSPEKETKKEHKRFSQKRLFRDEDNRVLGGVCSGLGHYLDVDPVWFRLGFVIALLFFGSSILIYLVLWIIIPKADSTEDKMHMKGAPMTIKEIENNIKEEFEDLKTRFHDMRGHTRRRTRREMHELKRKIHQAKHEAKYSYRQCYVASAVAAGKKPEHMHHHGFGSVFGEIFYYLLRALLIFAGIVLLIVAIILTGSLVLSLTASDSFVLFTKWGISSVSVPALSNLFFENQWQQQLTVITLLLLIGVPLLMLIFNSIRMIIGFKTKHRIISITASLMWLTGLIIAIFLTINIVGNFNEKTFVKTEVVLPQPRKTLTIDITDNLPGIRTTPVNDEENDESNVQNHQHFIFNNCFFSEHNDKLIAYGFPKLKIVAASGGEYKLTVIKFARGTSLLSARHRAEAIKADVATPDSTLFINNYFVLPFNEKWRNQSVKLLLEVPEGKSIFLTGNVENLVYDSNYLDGSWNTDMIGKKMTMHNGILVEYRQLPVKTDSIPAKKPVLKKVLPKK